MEMDRTNLNDSDVDLSVSAISISFDRNDRSLDQNRRAPITSTPRSKRALDAGSSSHSMGPPAKKPKKAPPPKFTCPECNKGYQVKGFFKSHMRGHAIDAVAARFPDKATLENHYEELAMSTLNRIIGSSSGGMVAECAAYMKDNFSLSFENFSTSVSDSFASSAALKKFILPSNLLASLISHCEYMTCNMPLRTQLISLLFCSFETECLEIFYCDYILNYAEVLLKFVVDLVIGPQILSKQIPEFDEEDRRSIHFVGGAILRGFLKKSYAFPSCMNLKNIAKAIVDCLAENGTNIPDLSDKAWTEAKNRGNLIFIGDDCLEFLVLVAEVIEVSEDSQGNISYSKVFEKVCGSLSATLYWDGMIGDALSERLSIAFMQAFVKSFTQVYGRGSSKRRLNMVRERPEASINLRHALPSGKVTR